MSRGFALVDLQTIADIERGLERARSSYADKMAAFFRAAQDLKNLRWKDDHARQDALRQHIAHTPSPEIAQAEAKHDAALAEYQDAEQAVRNQLALLDDYTVEAAARASQPPHSQN